MGFESIALAGSYELIPETFPASRFVVQSFAMPPRVPAKYLFSF